MKGFSKTTLVILINFLALLLVGYFAIKFVANKEPVGKIEKTSIAPTSDWQLFENKFFSIKYPNSWEIISSGTNLSKENRGVSLGNKNENDPTQGVTVLVRTPEEYVSYFKSSFETEKYDVVKFSEAVRKNDLDGLVKNSNLSCSQKIGVLCRGQFREITTINGTPALIQIYFSKADDGIQVIQEFFLKNGMIFSVTVNADSALFPISALLPGDLQGTLNSIGKTDFGKTLNSFTMK